MMNYQHQLIEREQMDVMLDTHENRREIVRRFGLAGFCMVYLPHYFYIPAAEFHGELAHELEAPENDMLEVVGFRGCAKSSFGSLALVLYMALEKAGEWPFIIPIADTAVQAGLNVAAIKNELEHNDLIKQDYGEFKYMKFNEPTPEPTLESEEEWQAKNMLLSNGVRILARSRGQKIRGLRHLQYRPRLVVVDDPEDLEWLHAKENRDKDERWMRSEIIPAMDKSKRKLVLIGNWLHTDGLMARMKKSGRFKILEYPLIKDGKCTWLAMYPTQESLDNTRKELGEVAWQREMLLRVVPEEGQEVKEEELHYYDKLTTQGSLIGTGLDYAFSEKETADYTAAVSGTLTFDESNHPHIDIHPSPLNARQDMPSTTEYLKAEQQAFGGNHIVFAEEVQGQKIANDELERSGLAVERMRPIKNKRARLRVAAVYIKNGTVRFPRTGCEDLLGQLLGFGIEEHDDLVDALVYLIIGLVQQGLNMEGVIAI